MIQYLMNRVYLINPFPVKLPFAVQILIGVRNRPRINIKTSSRVIAASREREVLCTLTPTEAAKFHTRPRPCARRIDNRLCSADAPWCQSFGALTRGNSVSNRA